MSAARHVVVALLLTLAAFGGIVWSASAAPQDSAAGSTLRLVCPLH
jgi:hypothetical protein